MFESKLKNVRNIIFDMDGTLVDTSKITVEACQRTAKEFSLPVRKYNEIAGLIGYADPEFFFRMYPKVNRNYIISFGKAVAKREHEYMIAHKEEILFDGVKELLIDLKKRGYYLSIASTGSLDHVNTALKASNIYNIFNDIKCNEAIKIEMVKKIISSGPEGEWLILGDRRKDFEAGNSNNIITVGAEYGFGDEEEMKLFDLTIDSPKKLFKLIEDTVIR
ncbi:MULTISPECIES: HAD family hydrolase [Clostridium]|jgi:phosphoglycolate phosphatase|uniref:HAD family hydrolase n=1 Tax=Clostridium TaxID=1485 RepID=UPI00115B301F|nr:MULTISPECIES: HAD family hydrolase [Clostridium]MBS5306658.1 HAD family hydrolase [Clostridium sp.]MDB1944678.1 HAD family hydrolase [Clostridium tertium]MDB1952140.1 HAD family hydrolase [Clostridium tertium]MDB1969022.1 HAD family hydrolase [Clostridium tertium]MDU1277408.1 HAD family hydrolase [Clostridium sp.]